MAVKLYAGFFSQTSTQVEMQDVQLKELAENIAAFANYLAEKEKALNDYIKNYNDLIDAIWQLQNRRNELKSSNARKFFDPQAINEINQIDVDIACINQEIKSYDDEQRIVECKQKLEEQKQLLADKQAELARLQLSSTPCI